MPKPVWIRVILVFAIFMGLGWYGAERSNAMILVMVVRVILYHMFDFHGHLIESLIASVA